MDVQEIQNNPAYHISYNPAYLIVKQDECYLFYNSTNHKAFRLSSVEFELLNLLYTYEDSDYIVSLFDGDIREDVIRIIEVIADLEILSLKNKSETDSESRTVLDFKLPTTYYIHLTHSCNLNCSYCYNKEWRIKGGKELSYNDWNIILSKIIPIAKTIVLTGGEFLLVPFVPKLLKSIKDRYPQVIIEGISNGCLDYSRDYIKESFKYIDKITLSCDSLNGNDERIGFNKSQFLLNISLITTLFPSVKIAISTTLTTKNYMSTEEIKILCETYGLEWVKTAVCPSSAKDIELMVELIQQVENIKKSRLNTHKANVWLSKQIRCGAAKTVCSIDAMGNVYPCQALHYEQFFMGNLLKLEVKELRYIADSSNVIPSVDDLHPCKICKVKYICGGGCFANRVAFNKTGKFSGIFCPVRYENSLSILLSLDNRATKDNGTANKP